MLTPLLLIDVELAVGTLLSGYLYFLLRLALIVGLKLHVRVQSCSISGVFHQFFLLLDRLLNHVRYLDCLSLELLVLIDNLRLLFIEKINGFNHYEIFPFKLLSLLNICGFDFDGLVCNLPVLVELSLRASSQYRKRLTCELSVSLHHFASGQHHSWILLNQRREVSKLLVGRLQEVKPGIAGLLLRQFLQELFWLISCDKLCRQFNRIELNLS